MSITPGDDGTSDGSKARTDKNTKFCPFMQGDTFSVRCPISSPDGSGALPCALMIDVDMRCYDSTFSAISTRGCALVIIARALAGIERRL